MQIVRGLPPIKLSPTHYQLKKCDAGDHEWQRRAKTKKCVHCGKVENRERNKWGGLE
jgi:hypothetical protein